MHDHDISIEGITRIEGHANLYVKVRDSTVEQVKLVVSENKRFYTKAIVGKPALAVPSTVSRICGVCSFAHTLCSIGAVENALGIQVSEQTRLLRKLAIFSAILRDHGLHLYFFCLPDIFNKESVLDFESKREKELLHQGLHVTDAATKLAAAIGGRAVHPPRLVVGGFAAMPKLEELKTLTTELASYRDYIVELVELFRQCDFSFERETTYVALASDEFNFLEGEIESSTGICIPEENYWNHLNSVVIPYSQASGYEFEGDDYMVGALSRVNLSKDALHKRTKESVKDALALFPSNNVYHNNLAQAIEMLHCLDNLIDIIEYLEIKPEKPASASPKAGIGIEVVEAARGTLYYMLSLDSRGIIRYGNLVIPTAQNQIRIERDIGLLVQELLDRPKEEIEMQIERLVRAYDPCMSCASHFLKVKWI
jgi:coenzyme F420-reducing hydrogenase alpha subunit